MIEMLMFMRQLRNNDSSDVVFVMRTFVILYTYFYLLLVMILMILTTIMTMIMTMI